MDNREYIQSLIDKARVAQQIVDGYNQEQVDKLAKAIGMAIYDAAEMLSAEAVEETHFGTIEQKIPKHLGSTASCWYSMAGKPSVGVINRIPEKGIVEFAKPMGVVAAITPATNPTVTAATNCMNAVKTRNACIIGPHPSAKKCTAHAIKIMNDKIVEMGGPANLVMCIEEPSIELSGLLMEMCDVTVATGGPGMVKAAYSSGKPSYGVGQGNVQCLVAPDWTDYDSLAKSVIMSRSFDNGVLCACEQTMHVPADKREEIIAAFVKNGAFELTDAADIDKIRKMTFADDGWGKINTKIVGHVPTSLCKFYGIEGCPENAPIIIFRVDKFATDEPLSREIMCPILRVATYDTFENGVENARRNLLFEGAGHSTNVWSNDDKAIELVGFRIPVCRIVVNQPNIMASSSPVGINGLNPTNSLGCGSWGNNSISENFYYKHLLNTTRLAYPLAGSGKAKIPTHAEIWELGVKLDD